jgi:hypothetical protein
MQLDALDIIIAVIAAMSVGFSKTGIPSSGIFTVTLMAMVFPAKESVGIVLPMLIIGDVIAVILYRHKVIWKDLLVLLPWVFAGVVAGYYFLSLVDDNWLKMTIGWLVLGLIVVHLFRERMNKTGDWPAGILSWFNPLLGILAGFATMIGNAAGGIMSIYLLAKKLPKEWFVGTAAWFFFIVNLLKVPFSVHLGIIHGDTLIFSAWMIVPIAVGAWLGIRLLNKLSERWFQTFVLAMSAIGSLKLILF